MSLRYNGGNGQVVYNYNYDFGGNVYKLNFKSISEGTIWEEEPENFGETLQDKKCIG